MSTKTLPRLLDPPEAEALGLVSSSVACELLAIAPRTLTTWIDRGALASQGRLRKKGTPHLVALADCERVKRLKERTLEDRFWEKVTTVTDCWAWQGATCKGYGVLVDDSGRSMKAHRLSYELHEGPIPHGFHIDHLCGNAWCVNPAHLEAVTQGENNQRSYDRGARFSVLRAATAA